MKIENAKIESTMLGFEDHGILTCMLTLDYGGSGQGFGGYGIDKGQASKWIKGILNVVGVSTWEELKNQHVRVKNEGGRILEIGHFLEDKWFNPKTI